MGRHPRILTPNASVWNAAAQLSRLGGNFQSRSLIFWAKGSHGGPPSPYVSFNRMKDLKRKRSFLAKNRFTS